MKKNFHLNLRISLAVAGLTVITSISPMIAASQVNKYKVYAHCCKCYGLFFYGYDPRMAHTCFSPECKILCPDCRKKLGDLNAALERLKGKNRGLKEAYDAFEAQYADALEKYNAALERTFGKEAGGVPSTWDYLSPIMQPIGISQPWSRGLSGLKGSFGGWWSAQLSLESNFAPSSKQLLTHITNGISIYQSGFTTTPDGAMTWGGVFTDYFFESEYIRWFYYRKEMQAALTNFMKNIDDGIPLGGAVSTYNLESAKALDDYKNFPAIGDFAGKALDVIGLILSTRTLINDVWDIIDNYRDGKIAEKQLKPITDSILKNDSAITCIQRTIDYLNSGGTGFLKNRVSSTFAVSILAAALTNQRSTFSSVDIDKATASRVKIDTNWQINEYKLESAFNKLKQLEKIQQQMMEIIHKQILPYFIPWALKMTNETKPSILLQMLKKMKAALPPLSVEYNKIKPLAESIFGDLVTAVTGCEIDYLSGNSNNFEIVSSSEIANGKKTGEKNTVPDADRWTIIPNEKIKTELGRVNMSFPAGVDWSVDFSTPENKFITNRSSFSKHPMFYDIAPGNYNITLNHITVENVPVEKGKEIKLKYGLLNLVTHTHWDMYNESKEKYYTSGNKPVKLALPVGTYLLNFEDKYYRVVIKDKLAVKFESPPPFLTK